MGYKLKLPHTIHQLFFWLHLLSLDIATGACLLSTGFLLLFPIEIPWYVYELLFSSALLVYWTDHLIDSTNAKVAELSMRHRFFNTHFTAFLIIIVLLICLNIIIAFAYLHWLSLLMATAFVSATLVYLFLHKKFPKILLFEKEVWVAGIYGFSIGLVPSITLGMYAFLVWHEILFLSLIISLCALQNTLSIAQIESHRDQQTGTRNLTTRYPSTKLQELQVLCLILQGCLSAIFIWMVPMQPGLWITLPLILNSLVQWQLPRYAQVFKDESYRYFGEWLFMACGLLWFIL